MKAIVYEKYGSPDVLQFKEVARPAPRDNEVLVRIHATTVTAADCQLRRSIIPRLFRLFSTKRSGPIILGQELAGEIESVGKAVTRFQMGDQVFGWSALRLGTYAEYACLPETAVLAIKPSSITYNEAAPLPVGGLEAVYFMRKANIQRGQKVLINGAGGSIGTYAVQLAKYFGAEVTGVESTGKLDTLRAIGADHVIDYTQQDFTKGGDSYDVIFDVVGKSSFSRSMNLLTPNGRYLLGNPRLSHMLGARFMSMTGSKTVIPWKTRTASEYASDIDFLKELLEAGKIKSVIDKIYPLEQIAEAHRYVDSGLKKGHVVISLEQNN